MRGLAGAASARAAKNLDDVVVIVMEEKALLVVLSDVEDDPDIMILQSLAKPIVMARLKAEMLVAQSLQVPAGIAAFVRQRLGGGYLEQLDAQGAPLQEHRLDVSGQVETAFDRKVQHRSIPISRCIDIRDRQGEMME